MPEGFEIADGYVDIHAEPDRVSARRAANMMADDVDRVGRRRRGGFFAAMFTPDAATLTALRTGVPAALATPIGIGAALLGAIWVTGFIAAIIAGLSTAGVAAAFIVIGAVALKENKKLVKMFEKTGETIANVFKRAAEPLLDPFLRSLKLFTAGLKASEPVIRGIFEALAPAIVPMTRSILQFTRTLGGAMAKEMPAFRRILESIVELMPGLAEKIGEMFNLFSKHEDDIIKAMEAVFAFIGGLVDFLARSVVRLIVTFNWMNEQFGKLNRTAKGVSDWFDREWSKVANHISLPVNRGVNRATARIFGLPRPVATVVASMGQFFATMHRRISNPFSGGVTSAIRFVATLPSRIRSAVGNLRFLLVNAGRDVIRGLLDGISSMFGSLASKVGEAAGIVGRFLPGSPVKEGPLKAFNQLSTNPGAKLAQMLQHGFSEQMKKFQLPTNLTMAGTAPNVNVSPMMAAPPVQVQVMLDGREIAPMVDTRIDDRNFQLKRAVTSGGSRIP